MHFTLSSGKWHSVRCLSLYLRSLLVTTFNEILFFETYSVPKKCIIIPGHTMTAPWHGNGFHITGNLWGESTGRISYKGMTMRNVFLWGLMKYLLSKQLSFQWFWTPRRTGDALKYKKSSFNILVGVNTSAVDWMVQYAVHMAGYIVKINWYLWWNMFNQYYCLNISFLFEILTLQ